MQSFKFISFLVFEKNRGGKGGGGFTPFPQAECTHDARLKRMKQKLVNKSRKTGVL